MICHTSTKQFKEPSDVLLQWKRSNCTIVTIFTLLILTVLPIIFRDHYFDILVVKYMFYYGVVIIMSAIMLIIALYYMYIDRTHFRGQALKILRNEIRKKKLKRSDWAMLAFLIVVTISTVQSEYFYESFWGNEGRYMGMFLILLYGVSFYAISHFLKFKQWYLDVFLAAGFIVCMIGVLQYFLIDPIGLKKGLSQDQFLMFTSTIGNINTYSSYVSLVSSTSVILFVIEKNIYRKIWYFISVIVSFCALITGNSDSAYLTLIALFGLLPLYLFKNLEGLKKYILLLSILFSEFQFIALMGRKHPFHVLGTNGLFNVIVEHDKFVYILAVLWAICIVLYIVDSRVGEASVLKRESNTGRWCWLALITFIVVIVTYVIYDVNVVGNVDKYGRLKEYLFFDDDWGTHRGYIWRICMESYQNFPFIHKIFGYGPDTFGIITTTNYYEEMVSRYFEKFDSVHNEYLQYLITIGIAGLMAYINLLITAIIEMSKGIKNNPGILAISAAIICYSVQAVVNISVPIVAPIMMTLLMIGMAAVNDYKEN